MGTAPIFAAQLQASLDLAHSSKIANWSNQTKNMNRELRNVIYPLVNDIQNHLNNPDLKNKPHDFSHLENQVAHLEALYNRHRDEFSTDFPNKAEELKEVEKEGPIKILPEDLTKLTEADLKVVEKILEQLKNSHNDSIQQTTNDLYLQGQLFITVTEILRRLQQNQEEHGRSIVHNQIAR